MTVKKEDIENEIEMFNKTIDGKYSYQISFYFEYSENGKSDIGQFRYAKATTDKDTEKSMLERTVKTFSPAALENCDLANFDILKNNKETIYYLEKGKLNNADKVLDKLEDPNFYPEEDLTVLGKLEKVKGAIVKIDINVNGKNEVFYLFMKLETFNGFKKSKLRYGFMANITKDGIKNITDNDTIFGVRDVIGFYYHNNHFIINNHSDFERMLFLTSEYRSMALKKANDLVNFKSILSDVDKLQTDLDGTGSMVLARMMAKMSIEDLKTKFSSNNLNTTFIKLDGIVKDDRFKEDFDGLKVNKENKTIQYETENKFKFVALLADRPSQTLLLGKKFMD